MKRFIMMTFMGFLMLSLFNPYKVFARPGDNGFDGGISSGYVEGRDTFEYKEVCFITGRPIVFTGKVTIKKTTRQDEIRSTYTFNLQNIEENATLRRTFSYGTTIEEKNNQVIEETAFSKTLSETIVIGGQIFTLQNYEFSRSNIIDKKPAVNYFAGNVRSKKTYLVGGSDAQVTVESTGDLNGYDQDWGSSETGKYNYFYQFEDYSGSTPEIWGGSAEINISTNTSKIFEYIENIPSQISFEGGYVQTQHNNSVLEYRYEMPEFDKDGISTDYIIRDGSFLNLETYPVQSRLRVPNINHIKGHWAYKDLMMLYSMEVFEGDEMFFDPDQHITRAEFANAIVKAAKCVPEDPELKKKNKARTNRRTSAAVEEKEYLFIDVLPENTYFDSINESYERGIMSGTGNNVFSPNNTITMADTLCIFIRALGLENLGPGAHAVTIFRDNDKIPAYARNAAYVAHRIGLCEGDGRGYLNPEENLTKGRAATLLNRFINYMREDIKEDYARSIIGF